MIQAHSRSLVPGALALQPRALAVGFVYWLGFLLALEPGNLPRGANLAVIGHEAMRIAGACVLGTSTLPLIVAMVRHFPVEGRDAWRHAMVQLAGCLALSAVLIVFSCILAEWLLPGAHPPLPAAIVNEFRLNWPLVAFCLAGLAALADTRFFRALAERHGAAPERDASSRYLISIEVKTRGRTVVLNLPEVDWIEAQGNYLALHAGAQTHLLRESLSTFAARLDPERFARIHRGAIIAIDRVCGMTPLGTGDAMLRLRDGTQLRLSRTYAAAFRQRHGTGHGGVFTSHP